MFELEILSKPAIIRLMESVFQIRELEITVAMLPTSLISRNYSVATQAP
jgi:hypothetical protein